MQYLIWFVVALFAVLFVGLLVADEKLADLRVVIGVVVKKRSASYPLSASNSPWEIYLRYETFLLEVDFRGEVDVVSVSKSQYDETPIGAMIYVKYLETRFLKDTTILEFAVLRS